MPVNPTRETEVREEIERDFASMERVSLTAGVGVLDVLQVYGGLDAAVRQADAYLALLNPISPNFSTTSSSNTQR